MDNDDIKDSMVEALNIFKMTELRIKAKSLEDKVAEYQTKADEARELQEKFGAQSMESKDDDKTSELASKSREYGKETDHYQTKADRTRAKADRLRKRANAHGSASQSGRGSFWSWED